MVKLITEHMDIWTAAQTPKTKGGRGRGNNSNGQSIHGMNKLRELILELAVRGKLVPQDPNDEPAIVLLNKIAKEKALLIKEGKIKKQKPLPEISEGEKPFELPVGWEWTRLGNIGDWGAGSTPNRKNSDFYGGDMPWLKSGELRDNKNLSSSEETVTYKSLKQCSLRVCNPGDVLIAMYGATIGMLAILDIIATTNQAVCACTCHSGVFNRYLFTMLKAWRPKFTGQGAGGAQPNISKVKIINTIAPLPPLAEQYRIVVKVDELMSLCDRLEQQQADSNEIHQILVETLLATLTQADDQRGFSEAWQRIADHFDTLFTTESSIYQLEQTLLQLAVIGKLVPQDPNDEPASVLLNKIAKEKALLIKEGKIKKQKPLPEISEGEKPFELPVGWEWTRLGNISYQITDGTHYTPTYTSEGVPFLSVKDMSSGYLDFLATRFISKEQHEELIKRCQPCRGDLLLTKVGTTGIPVLVKTDKPFSLFVSVALIKFAKGQVSGKFLSMLIKSPFVAAQSEEGTEGIGNKNLVLRKITAFVIVIPPLAEQHRIVAKVDELMALCDDLKNRLKDAQTTQVQLADAIVEQSAA